MALNLIKHLVFIIFLEIFPLLTMLKNNKKLITIYQVIKYFINIKVKLILKHNCFLNYIKLKIKKLIALNYSGNYNRLFPMAGIFFETPIVNRINEFKYNTKNFFNY